MNTIQKNIALVAVLVIIAGSIWYLEASKPKHDASSVQAIVVTGTPQAGPEDVAQASSTAPSASPGIAIAPSSGDRTSIRQGKALKFPRAKELVDPTGFINTAPFKLSDIVGKKVVLLDFWTYSCINCQRTIPYLNAWYQKYKDLGLEIVGIHTPEFGFEKDLDNVSKAVKAAGIQYPVVLDSNMGTWNAYQNNYWPREYLIDIDGFIVHDNIGEGKYAETEQAIQDALLERQKALGIRGTIPATIVSPADAVSMDSAGVKSPETYFGAARNSYLANGVPNAVGMQTLMYPPYFNSNQLYLSGVWNFSNEYAESTGASSKITFKYNAKNVYFVASSAVGVKVKILRDGVPVGTAAGEDVAADGTVFIKENRLYKIIKGDSYGEHTLEIEVQGAGLDAFTFTFG